MEDPRKPKLALISTENEVSTIGVVKNKTLEDLLIDQLENMSDEDLSLDVYDAVLIIETNNGLAHINLTSTSIYRRIGMLEVMKNHMINLLSETDE